MFITSHNYTIGIDVSDQSLKMVQLKRKRGNPHLVSYNYKNIPKGVIERGIIINKKKFNEILTTLVEKPVGKRSQTKKIVLNLPDQQTFTKVITIPKGEKEKLEEDVLREAAKHIPINPDDAYIDWQVTGVEKNTLNVFVATVPKKVSDDFADAMSEAGFEPMVFDIESVALLRALSNGTFTSPTLIIDFGHSKSNATIVEKDALELTMSIPLSGDIINETVSQKLKLTIDQAEKAKIQCGLDKEKCKGALRIVLDAALDDLAFKINDAIEFYSTKLGGTRDIATIVITGGGANFLNIEEVLALKTKKKVVAGNGLANVSEKDARALFAKKRVSPHFFTLSIGLALRGFLEETV